MAADGPVVAEIEQGGGKIEQRDTAFDARQDDAADQHEDAQRRHQPQEATHVERANVERSRCAVLAQHEAGNDVAADEKKTVTPSPPGTKCPNQAWDSQTNKIEPALKPSRAGM